ncbi:MAG: alcohol dehydrogenase catalytic domain-containing protein [Acidobacteriaceae bacterium]
MSTMYGLAKLQPAVGLWETSAEIPRCGPEDVLIKIRHTAICGTDLHIYKWDDWAAATVPVPMIVGT